MRLLALAALVVPGPARAHDAFGDLGPFYQGLLHPLLAPEQGLLLAALAVIFATQSLAAVRIGYAALALACVVAAVLHLAYAPPGPGVRLVGVTALCLGVVAVTGLRLPAPVVAAVAAIGGVAAVFSGDLATTQRAAWLGAGGGALGAALFVLLLWGVVDLARDRFGRVGPAVAASWVAAVGAMAAALPAA